MEPVSAAVFLGQVCVPTLRAAPFPRFAGVKATPAVAVSPLGGRGEERRGLPR